MSESADDIRQRMQGVRREVAEDMQGIVQTARTLTDWRYHVKNHPWACVGLALAAGYLIVPARKKAATAGTRELIELLKKHNLSLGEAAGAKGGGGFFRTMLAAATPVVARLAMNVASQKFAGGANPWASAFGDHQAAEDEDMRIPR